MNATVSREIRLASRPSGIPTADNFTLARIELAPPQDGQVLVRYRYMSVDRQAEFEKEVEGYFKAGKVKHKETVVKGIDQAVGAFLGLFQGRNVGKMVMELA